MSIAEKGKLFCKCNFFIAILIFIYFVTLQGCSQQFTNTSLAGNNKSLVELMTESVPAKVVSAQNSSNISGTDRYLPIIKKYSQEYGIDWILVLSVMKQESRFDHDAVSQTGAYGLMQIMPLTQIELAEKLGVEETLTPKNNIKAGIFHLKWLYEMFDNVPREDRTRLTLAAYNAGLRRVYDAQRIASYLGNDPNRWTSVKEALALLSRRSYTLHEHIWTEGIPPSGYFRSYRQTVDYVDNIMRCYDRYSLTMN
jgi:membrane-bound lytic murein transglycosylase MltF